MIDTSSEMSAATAGIIVNAGTRNYLVLIGYGLIEAAPAYLMRHLGGARYAIVADEFVAHLAKTLEEGLAKQGLLLGPTCFVPSGEGSKSFARLESVCGALLDLGLERSHAVIALGGGVIGDLAGFAAAIVKRGVRVVQIPTTLLAQVDSSVGGKTGINARQGKNLIGAFHQPSLVLADLASLKTLPPREFRAGYAEVMKYGALGDASFFQWLEENWERVFAQEEEALTRVVEVSCTMKANIVARDEFETGDRALLNLGHTFGHAIEAWAGYSGKVLHGEAVALGTVLAAQFSHRQGLCDETVPQRLEAHLANCGFATSLIGTSEGNAASLKSQTGSVPTVQELLHFMEQDKKVRNGQMTFILLRAMGQAFVARNVSRQEIGAFLEEQLSAGAA